MSGYWAFATCMAEFSQWYELWSFLIISTIDDYISIICDRKMYVRTRTVPSSKVSSSQLSFTFSMTAALGFYPLGIRM